MKEPVRRERESIKKNERCKREGERRRKRNKDNKNEIGKKD